MSDEAYNARLEADLKQAQELMKRYAMCGHDHSTAWWQIKAEDLERQVAELRVQLRLANIDQANTQAEVADLTAKLKAQNAEIRDMRKSIDTAAKGIVRLTMDGTHHKPTWTTDASTQGLEVPA